MKFKLKENIKINKKYKEDNNKIYEDYINNFFNINNENNKNININGDEENLIKIPWNIQREINEKWFYVYNWIEAKEIKQKIQLEFLKTLPWLWFLWIVFLLIWISMWKIEWVIFVTTLLMVSYTIILSISKAIEWSKISHLILTTSHYSLNKKIKKIEDWGYIKLENDILKISKDFNEPLFWKNWTQILLKEETKKTSDLIFDWFNAINKVWGKSKEAMQVKSVILIIYITFIVSAWILYFFWILISLFFWIFINFITKKYLIAKWNIIVFIEEKFKDIEKHSSLLKQAGNSLTNRLIEARNNQWQDWLLLKINKGIEVVNKEVNSAMNENLQLINKIKESSFNSIFNYWIYNSWLKQKIANPIKWIIKILETNISIIEDEIKNNSITINNLKDNKLISNVELSNVRLNMKKEEIQWYLINMNWYLLKLNIIDK